MNVQVLIVLAVFAALAALCLIGRAARPQDKQAVAAAAPVAARAGIGRARVVRASGLVEIHYSLPKLAWWDLTGRLWVRRRLRAMHREDEIWLKQNAPSG